MTFGLHSFQLILKITINFNIFGGVTAKKKNKNNQKINLIYELKIYKCLKKIDHQNCIAA